MTSSIPLTAAFVAFIFLHRRYKRKLRAEDRADEEKYKSMDFGMDLRYGNKKKNSPEMSRTGGRDIRNMRGLSMEAGSPYLFPGGHGSSESLASIAHNTYDADHRYKQVDSFIKRDDMSIRTASPRGRRGTDSTTSTPYDVTANANLLGNAQGLPKSAPHRGQALPPPPEPPVGYPTIQEPEKAMLARSYDGNYASSNTGLAPALPEIPRTSYIDHKAFRQSNNYLRGFIHSREPSGDEKTKLPTKVDSNASTIVGSFGSDKLDSPKISVAEVTPSPLITEKPLPVDPRAASNYVENPIHDANSTKLTQYTSPDSHHHDQAYDETPFKVTPPSPDRSHFAQTPRGLPSTSAAIPPRGQSLATPKQEPEERRESQYLGDSFSGLDYNPARLSVLMRPLPPDDPTENPEERANRIRSFYKEYFDDSKPQSHPPVPAIPEDYSQYDNYLNYQEHEDPQHYQGDHQQNHQPNYEQNYPQSYLQHQQNHVEYYEDYDTEYSNNTYNVYDSHNQGFVVAAPYAEPITRRAMTPPPRAPPRFQVQGRGRSSSAAGSQMSGLPPRGQSSMSNYRSGPNDRGRAQNRRPMPPPAPLISLKTPHLLKDDSALYTTMDLAPPPSYRDRQIGRRPDSPLGVERPYSPSVRAHVPLNSAFDELSPMPSP
jgi:hypothetical protein